MFHQSLFRRTVTLLIIFVLSLSILAGCTMPTAGDVSTTESSETETVNEEAVEEEPVAEEAEEEATVEESGEEVSTEEEAAEEVVEEEVSEEPEDASTDEAEATEAESTDAAASAPRTYTIAPEQSEARFTIDEVLMGNDKTVVGVTSALSGDVQFDMANPADAQIGAIEIETGGFVTDSDRRNGAIRRFVLQSDSYPSIRFEPTSVDGLPDAVEMGQPMEFTVTGDLTILETTSPATFNLSVTQSSENELSGLASTTILYADYGVSIPSVPIVASVSEELLLELEFVAVATE